MVKDMKSAYYILIGCVILCFTSCKTTTMLTVHGEPGTQILTPDKKTLLATIDNSGKAVIANPDNDYYAFLLSCKPGTEEYIPFALDYMKKSYPVTQFAKGLGIGLAGAGTVMLIPGTIAMLAGAEGLAGPMLLSGFSLDLIGLGIGWPADLRSRQTSYYYCYKYTSEQKTNQDLQFTKPQFELYKPETPVLQNDNVETGSKTNKTLSSSSSTKTLKDNAAKIEGTYVGEGTLKQGNEIIETYNSISISIKRKSKDIVLVNVIESDGSKFFATDGEYNIKKQSDGKYVLTLNGINNATIEIDTNNSLIYIHPRVNIDNEIYILTINAKK